MRDYTNYYEARALITEILAKDLIGPVTADEILTELPAQYYLMGKLYPRRDQEAELDITQNLILDDASDAYDSSISLSNNINPSSMGVTVIIKADADELTISGGFAFYDLVPFGQAQERGISTKQWENAETQPEELWVRHEYSYSHTVSLYEAQIRPIKLERGIEIRVFMHKRLANGDRIVTIVMVNQNKSLNDRSSSSLFAAFQPVMKLTSPTDDSIFSNIDRRANMTSDPELLELEMLYSGIKCYAQGHGCSVLWDSDCDEPKWIETSFFPSYDLLQMKAAEMPDNDCMSMQFLATADADHVIETLNDFVRSYQTWIDELTDRALLIDKQHLDAAKTNICKCRQAADRISNAVKLLARSASTDGIAFRAFQLANEAMLMQRGQTVKKAGKAFSPNQARWYPFQLAFILHELPSFIEPNGRAGQERSDRSVADLLWFPTGGGKTEAYLGISAFVIFLRRLRNKDDDGVTIIMRYTLRLLTLQQFERASMLIFACELLRQKYDLGGSEISIGLWVGGALTPNTLDDARQGLNDSGKTKNYFNTTTDPVQVKTCPWCGQQLFASDYAVDATNKRMMIKCPNKECDMHRFRSGLPLHIIDEAIYAHTPTFVVATIDKFAQIPLDEKPAALFGITSNKRPPELIIQDELHLISGPLGTVTGIYEAAIIKLCERDGVPVKVIASTATIRNAADQILSLYGRSYVQFPPQGISISDSFFAVGSTPEERPARQYVGVMGVGTTATTTLIRVYAAMLFATRYLAVRGYSDDVIDNFWTLTGYFNSLRELGGTSSTLHDSVQSRFEYLSKTKFAGLYTGSKTDNKGTNILELTSRMSNADITDAIQIQLKKQYRKNDHNDVIDVVLASNMISVGVDVGRLGAMIVACQPKTNSEYIQATSRVGRDSPGLVITVYSNVRSRDRSHYEQFLKYHSSLYKYVEAVSLTPFSDRARDRCLHALYVALCRYLDEELLSNDQAKNYSPDRPVMKQVRQYIQELVSTIDPDELQAVMDELSMIEERWAYEAQRPLVYRAADNNVHLLQNATVNTRFSMMNSMRNVDEQSCIYLIK